MSQQEYNEEPEEERAEMFAVSNPPLIYALFFPEIIALSMGLTIYVQSPKPIQISLLIQGLLFIWMVVTFLKTYKHSSVLKEQSIIKSKFLDLYLPVVLASIHFFLTAVLLLLERETATIFRFWYGMAQAVIILFLAHSQFLYAGLFLRCLKDRDCTASAQLEYFVSKTIRSRKRQQLSMDFKNVFWASLLSISPIFILKDWKSPLILLSIVFSCLPIALEYLRYRLLNRYVSALKRVGNSAVREADIQRIHWNLFGK